MAQLHRSVATLRISGETLVPEEISRALGCEPTRSEFKGQVIRGKKTGRERIARISSWRLEATDQEPENLNKQVAELLGKMTQDLNVWKTLSGQFEIDLFCGLFMKVSNEGFSISPGTLEALGNRGIELSLDIYDPDKEPTTTA